MVTINALNPQTKRGWRRPVAYGDDLLTKLCSNNETVEGCIFRESFNKDDFLKDILLGFNEKQSFGNFCTEDFGELWYGRQYIIDLPFKLVPSIHGQLFFLVEYGLNYRFTFHDRSFYMLNDNPVAFPTIIKIFNPNKTFNNFYMRIRYSLGICSDSCSQFCS